MNARAQEQDRSVSVVTQRGTAPGLVRFTVPGEIVPWARAGGGKNTPRFTPKRQRTYKGVIADYAHQAHGEQPLFDCPCELKIVAYYQWPKSWSANKRAKSGGWKYTKPDADNITKIVKDAMNGIVYTDDARVVSQHCWKKFADKPCLMVEVRPLVTP